MTVTPKANRALFVATILTGSFLLFLVQPMVARMALPRLGGAPNVWNSAMLVYQALLLAGYGYAHRLSRYAVKTQARIHLVLLLVAALSLPIALASLPPAQSGMEVLWVPALLALTIGPVFFLVSAQAPLMQRWYAADPSAGEPWALYAASNFGSFAGLIAYPLLAEPLLALRAQSLAWSIGYGVLFVLVALCALARRGLADIPHAVAEAAEPLPRGRVLLWLVLAAVPSGLMLSTTTHLTTDLFAMPLLWVIPLGLYLLSFVFAFADRRGVARTITAIAPLVMLLGGGLAMSSRSEAGLIPVFISVGLLFVVCVALHARLYDLRPEPARLTYFYFVMSAGGALGGAFTALVAPIVFDWVWEHPVLVLAAAALLPRDVWLDWARFPGQSRTMVNAAMFGLVALAGFLLYQLHEATIPAHPGAMRWALALGISLIGVLLVRWRVLSLVLLLLMMVAQGGYETFKASRDGLRTRSYFGIYTVRTYPEFRLRTLAHGTTLHGEQSFDPALRRMPMTYYGPGSGAGIAFLYSKVLFGENPRLGVVGLGTGSLACYKKPGESLTFFEIDPAVLALSRNRTFTYVADCAPDSTVRLGDARLELANVRKGSIDALAVDAFSSDAIPLHLLTDEAIGVYLDALSPKGVLLIHISNRYIDLEPVLGAVARKRGLVAAMRDDIPSGEGSAMYTASSWVLLTRDAAQLETLRRVAPAKAWRALENPAAKVWTDDHASILPYIEWRSMIGRP